MIQYYIKEQKDMKEYKPYIDDGYTGTDLERPGFKEMLNDIYKNHKESKDNYKYMLINGDQLDLWYDKIEYKLNNSNIYVKIVRTKKETLEMISIRYKTFTQQMNIQFDNEFDGSDNNAVNFSHCGSLL